jgi:type IV pilus assembly protein PilM
VAFGLHKLAGFSPWSGGGLVAVDLGGQTLKVLQLTPGESPQLIAAGCVQTPPELVNDPTRRLDYQFEQLPGLLKAAGVKAKRAVCAIPCAQMVCRHMQVQPEGKQTIGEATRLSMALQLGCEAGALSMREIVVPGTTVGAGKTEVIAFATAASVIARLMQGLRSAKLEPVGMQSEFEAVVNVFRPTNRTAADAETTSLYLDIGSTMTQVCLGHGPNIVFAKAIALGGRFLDAVVAKQAGCSITEARALRLSLNQLTRSTPTSLPTIESGGMAVLAAAMRKEQAEAGIATLAAPTTSVDAVTALANHAERTRNAVDLTEPLRALTDEIALCVRYYETLFPQRKVHRTIFVGGESRHVALCQHIARMLKTPAHAADPLARIARTGKEPVVGVDMSQAQPGWAVPMGLLMAPTDL